MLRYCNIHIGQRKLQPFLTGKGAGSNLQPTDSAVGNGGGNFGGAALLRTEA